MRDFAKCEAFGVSLPKTTSDVPQATSPNAWVRFRTHVYRSDCRLNGP
jgi:hypothetical protein